METKYALTIALFLFSFTNETLSDSVDLVVENQDDLANYTTLAVLTFRQDDKVIKDESSNPEVGDGEDDVKGPMGFIGLVEKIGLICPDRFLYVNRFIGKSYVDNNYFNVTVNPRFLNRVRAVNLWLQMSTNVTIGLQDPAVATVKDLGGNAYLIESRGSISNLKFDIRGTPRTEFPRMQRIHFNGNPVCLNMRAWESFEPEPAPRATSSALIPPTKSIPNCGRKQDHTPLVINGERTKPGDWPWHVAMFVRETRDGPWTYQCGGTVVSRTAVLSACHCVLLKRQFISPDNMILAMGKYNLYEDDEHSTNYTVKRIVSHPQYDFNTLRNDFAIIFTTKDIVFNNFVQPICLWDQKQVEKNVLYGEFGSVVGWGTKEGYERSEQLTTGRMRVIPDQNCLDSLPNFFSRFLNVNTFCAGNGPDNLTSACNGDSGGSFSFPITMADGRVTWFLRGVVSLSVAHWSTGTCDPRHHIVIADAASQAEWLYSQTGVQPYNDTSPAVAEASENRKD